MKVLDCCLIPILAWRSLSSLRHARKSGLPGLSFDRFGRKLGLKLISKGIREGFLYALNPVSCFRYFEFDFVASSIPDSPALRCFDVSSPRLFAIWLCSTGNSIQLTAINPHRSDIETTDEIVKALNIDNIHLECAAIDYLLSHKCRFDFIYSISVIEHIGGLSGDTEAMETMWNALKPGGTLAVTFPVDRKFREEFRDRQYYGTQEMVGENYFFQRYYDFPSIRERLLLPIALPESEMRFYGERVPGFFLSYEERWMRQGLNVTVEDARIMANNFSEYPNWDEMPGIGVCGLRIVKPR